MSKTLVAVACFYVHLHEGDALEKGNVFIQYPGLCSFRMYIGMRVYLQNCKSNCLFFPAPSGGRSKP